MAKKIHLILIAILSLHLIAAANLPQTYSAQNGPDTGETLPPVSTTNDEPNIAVDPASTGCTTNIIPAQNAAYEQAIVEMVNAERANANLPPLKFNENLANASRYHANDLLVDDYFNHDSYDRVGGNLQLACGVWDRVANFYTFSGAGENIAAGFSTPDAVMQGWMGSDSHRANILNPDFRELGVGFYTGYRGYWVQDFGYRANVYPVIINGENQQTDNRSISMYLYGEGIFREYRIKDDASQWTAWQPFQKSIGWTLNGPGNATRTVTVELRKTSGEVISSSDSIFLYGQPSLGNLPGNITFLYVRATGVLTASNNTLKPLNVGTNDVLNWTLSASGSWIDLSATSGTTPNTQVVVSARNLGSLNPGTYSGNLTFLVTTPTNVAGSPSTIPVTLIVVNDLSNKTFLPAVLH